MLNTFLVHLVNPHAQYIFGTLGEPGSSAAVLLGFRIRKNKNFTLTF